MGLVAFAVGQRIAALKVAPFPARLCILLANEHACNASDDLRGHNLVLPMCLPASAYQPRNVGVSDSSWYADLDGMSEHIADGA